MVDYLNPNIHWRARIRGLGPKDQLGCLHGILFLLMAAALLVVAAMFAGCTTTQYVPVPEYHTDTTYITKQQRDSVWLHDSIQVTEKGDTVRIEKWHTKYIEKQVHDTTYVATHDTIPQPYEVVKEVPAELTWWQRVRLWLGNMVLFALLGVVGYYGWRIWKVYRIF